MLLGDVDRFWGRVMPNSLGLDDDLDGVEVVRDLERIFDIKVSNEEGERIFTVGEFHDPLVWSGRASQEGFVDLSALRSCINVSGL
jgi:hypothetical protein